MSTVTFSFRASTEFVERTKAQASVLHMSSSDYVRDAVREKNERVLKERIAYLSKQLPARHLVENQTMDAAAGDGLA